jgi:hypothetical protein
MTPPSVDAVEILASGGAPARSAPRRRQFGALLVGVAAAGGVVAAVVPTTGRDPQPSVAFVEALIDSWNARDAQAVSSMTCDYIPAFVPAGVIEDHMDLFPDGQTIVGDHRVGGVKPLVLEGREVERVTVTFVVGDGERSRRQSVYVRVRDDGERCLAQFNSW